MKGRLVQCFLIILFSCESNDIQPVNGRCSLEPDAGLCFAAFEKYYFDKAERKCKPFTWGGCGGVVPFNTLEECQDCERGK